MSFSHLLDTSVLSQPLKNTALPGVQRRWAPERALRFCTSAICLAELLRGIEERGSKELWRRYRRCLEGEIIALPFGAEAAAVYGRLCASMKAAGTCREVGDLLIAAAAIAEGLVLVTLNIRHFEGIPDLEVEDWSA